MAEKYRAVAILKMSNEPGDNFQRGEYVKASDFDPKEKLAALVESGSVMSEKDFARTFPGFDDVEEVPEEVEPEPEPDSEPEPEE